MTSPPGRRLLLATRNPKKLVELQRILNSALGVARLGEGGWVSAAGAAGWADPGRGPEAGPRPVELVGLTDVPEYPETPESGLTFGENALIKARAGVRYTGLPTIADDSGLAVDALNGMPGVFSARWCGRHGDDRANLELLLAQLAEVPDDHRGASFVCTAALVLPESIRRDGPGGHFGTEHLVDGRQTGRLLRSPRGDGGFGYDPIFVSDGEVRSNAELTAEEKDAISHRGKAFRGLAQLIARRLP